MKKLLIMSGIIALGFTAVAQTTIAPDGVKITPDSLKKRVEGYSSFIPNGNGLITNLLSDLSVSSSFASGTNAKASLKYQPHPFMTLGLSLDQKISKGDQSATLYDFDKGASPGSTLGVDFQYMLWNIQRDDAYQEAFYRAFLAARKEQPQLNKQDVTREFLLPFAAPTDKDILENYQNPSPVFLSFKFSMTKSRFSFVTDSVRLNKGEEIKLSPDLTFALVFPSLNKGYFAIGYTYSQNYEASSVQTFIRSFGTTSHSVSQSLSFGRPKHARDHKLRVEYRYNFRNLAHLAIAPSLTYGFESEKLAFTFPVYFLKGTSKEEKSGVQGGLVVGYVTNTRNQLTKFKEGFGTQLVVSVPLDFFNLF